MGRAEALTLSANHFEIFTIWEDINALARKQALDITYFDPAIHAGTEDGRNAFTYCGGVLRQPPYTPVFFAVDFDPEDPTILGGVSPVDAKNHIIQYFVLIRNERDAYANIHPGRCYLIGVYGKAAVLEWCYKESTAVSIFWQSASTGSSNRRPKRPWCHANRWQIADDSRLRPVWNVIPGADPDVDWFDGGTWRLTYSLEQQLEQAEGWRRHSCGRSCNGGARCSISSSLSSCGMVLTLPPTGCGPTSTVPAGPAFKVFLHQPALAKIPRANELSHPVLLNCE